MALSHRDDFTNETKQLLARRAGFKCSICEDPTVGPHHEEEKSVFIGEASHIYSAAPQGPRSNPKLTPEERKAPANGIHLCKKHARLIDVDVDGFPAEKLKEIKRAHEDNVRSLLVGPSQEYDAAFLSSHETQVVHSRGNPTLVDLWVPRKVVRPNVGNAPEKKDPSNLVSDETGVLMIAGDQSSGRTSLLKRLAAAHVDSKNCVWLKGVELTEKALKDPLRALAAGYSRINALPDGWTRFLESDASQNLIFIDDIHLSPLNIASKRRLLRTFQDLCKLVVVTTIDPFLVEIITSTANDHLRLECWRLLDLTRADCAMLTDKWCRYGGETIEDHKLDARVSSATNNLEILFGKKLMPRIPLFVLTALQGIDAGTPLDTSVGSFGGVYETVIHLAIAKNAQNQAAISNERAYLEELAYWCEFQPPSDDRKAFNAWFAEQKGVRLSKVEEIESSLLSKNFLSRTHQCFRFNYQRYYFLASFIRNHPSRAGVQEFIEKMIAQCWNEHYANTALFLAYLQPSSRLIEALLIETNKLFEKYPEFRVDGWKLDAHFPKEFFKGLTLSSDPEANRRALAERMDEISPIDSSVCVDGLPAVNDEVDESFQNYLKSFHLIKLIGQLIRNAPIAFDAQQKREMIGAGFRLSLRVVSVLTEVCDPSVLQTQVLNEVRTNVLKIEKRVELEAKLTGLIYNMSIFLYFSALRHSCYYLAHPDLTLLYPGVLRVDSSKDEDLSFKLLNCGVQFELRSPDVTSLRKVYNDLKTGGQDLLHVWTWLFLSFNRVTASKRQGLLEAVDMSSNVQLLLPRGGD